MVNKPSERDAAAHVAIRPKAKEVYSRVLIITPLVESVMKQI